MAQNLMRYPALCVACVCSLSLLGCGGAIDDARQQRCDDVTQQIDAALYNYIDSGNLLPDAVPCELTPASFDPRVARDNVELVLSQFANACDIQANSCAGAPPSVGPPHSIPPYDGPEPAIDPQQGDPDLARRGPGGAQQPRQSFEQLR